ncbi:NOL1/NOP2/sun family putative RNA methylase [Candidatus Peregrinibacteria bacterium]|nr:NOL1/NOP2/sun family putative RNA methylase [Candidatus Peregrinibacteria bacterium]
MQKDFSAFDRYKAMTDIGALCAFSAKPLRKCIRVNTLKTTVEAVARRALDLGWKLDPVPWCSEGFFIDREDRSVALGKDLLHLTGAIYMQEAASMLPPALLDPRPGETVLDMAAAPGSKSTQIAAMMQGRGVLVCNDMQERRLWTLMTALNRLGVINVAVTKKIGQWFAKQMTERFDRVLIDAPCTAQGTVRKDTDALSYTSEHGIGKATKLQRELLEAAIHATKIGGRIVYSTCTLTPEENEGVVADMLKKFEGQVEAVDPTAELGERAWGVGKAIEDSHRVQRTLHPTPNPLLPLLRLWPQTYDTEGFFCAVLRKLKRTREPERFDTVRFSQEMVMRNRTREIRAFLQERYGVDMLTNDEVLLQENERFWVTTESVCDCAIPAPVYAVGLPFGKTVSEAPVCIDHDLATLRGSRASSNSIDLTPEQLRLLMGGQDCDCDPALVSHVLLKYEGRCIGRGRAKEGRCKNHLPRWMVQMGIG